MLEYREPYMLRATTWARVCSACILGAVALGLALLATAGGDADAATRGAQQASLIASQDFEGTVFPPAGWRVVDQLNNPTSYVWGRETCEVEPGAGGTASAWAVGGGSGGSGLACGATYSDPVDTFLIYGPFDTLAYDLGIRVGLKVWLDIPASPAFIVCARHGPGDEDFQCFETGATETDWESFAPLDFPLTAGRTDVEVWINYRDRVPVGGHVGAFVDNVVIEGLSSGAPTTATASATRTATRTATSGPSPTASATATPSRTASASVTPSRTATQAATSAATKTATKTATGAASPSATNTAMVTPRATATGTPTGSTTTAPTVTSSPTGPSTPGTAPATEAITATATVTGTAAGTSTIVATGSVTTTSIPEVTATGPTPPDDVRAVYLPIANRRR